MKYLEMRTRYDDQNKIFYKTRFIVVDQLPEVGGTYDGQKVKALDPVRLDVEERSDEENEYDFYKIETADGQRSFIACKAPKLRVEFHHWKEFEGYSHSETFDHCFVGQFTSLENSAKEYFENYDGDLLDDLDPGEGINIEMYDDNDNLVSEYFVVKE